MKKMITCGFLLPIATLALIACSGNNDLTNQLKGSWVAPINGMPEQMEGFELKDNGLASSINMATLVYEKWETSGCPGTSGEKYRQRANTLLLRHTKD